jgi:hypothetical protein
MHPLSSSRGSVMPSYATGWPPGSVPCECQNNRGHGRWPRPSKNPAGAGVEQLLNQVSPAAAAAPVPLQAFALLIKNVIEYHFLKKTGTH